MLIGLVAGALLLGTGVTALHVQAADKNDCPPPPHHDRRGGQPGGKLNPDAMAKHVHEAFGVAEADVKAAIEAKKDFHDIGQAAMLAKLSGKSFNDVLALKTDSTNWRDIGNNLGVSDDQVRNEMDTMMAAKMAKHDDISQETALSLIKNGYRPHDIERAAKLAKVSNSDIQAVLDMKKINNRWEDVAEKLGVDKSVLRPQRPSRDKDDAVCARPPMNEPIDEAMMVDPPDMAKDNAKK